MKVLFINKFYYRRGGSETSMFSTAKVLEDMGHKVIFFSMAHPRNLQSPYSPFFLSNVDYDNCDGFKDKLKAMGRMLYSIEARNKLRELIKQESPDIAHLHNIGHQISPSVIDELKASGIPTVMTLHDYKLVCPAYSLFNDGRPCDGCFNRKYYRAVSRRCMKGSVLKSALCALEMYLHHSILEIYSKIDTFIAPSNFLLEKVRGMGFKGNIKYLPNSIDLDSFKPAYCSRKRSIVYFGRLSAEKGIITLAEAVKGLDIRLKIIGDGPLSDSIKDKVKKEGIRNIDLMGYMTGKALHDEISGAMFTVVPSEWNENNPLSVIESFALGKPVIGARTGGLPELIHDGKTGITFEAGNAPELREKIRHLVEQPALIQKMGMYARAYAEREFGHDRHYEEIMKIYEGALNA